MSGDFAGLAALVDAGWKFAGRIDGYGRSFNTHYNVNTGERLDWTTPATSLDCQCDICIVWRRRGDPPMHPPLVPDSEG
jgi:hypothetical protein